jgi:hypothetical protein
MPVGPDLPGYISKIEVELMIERSLRPIHRTLAEMKTHNLSLYGNGSGRRGYLESMEAKQDDRWDEQTATNQRMFESLTKISSALKSSAAVVRDRKWLITTCLVAVPVLVDIYFKLLHGGR